MNNRDLVLIGAGGHAYSCIDVIEQTNKFDIVGLVGLATELNSTHLGYAVIATDHDLPDLATYCRNSFVAVGQIKDPTPRIRLYNLAIKTGFTVPIIVSPKAYVSRHAHLGSGTIVMHGCSINAGATVGDNCVINTHSTVEHGVMIGNHCHLSPGALINGDAQIGNGTFVGSGSVIRNGIVIGKQCVIGAGVSVLRDVKDHQIVTTHSSNNGE